MHFAQIFWCSFSYSCSAFEFRISDLSAEDLVKADCGFRKPVNVNVPVNVKGFWALTLVADPRPAHRQSHRCKSKRIRGSFLPPVMFDDVQLIKLERLAVAFEEELLRPMREGRDEPGVADTCRRPEGPLVLVGQTGGLTWRAYRQSAARQAEVGRTPDPHSMAYAGRISIIPAVSARADKPAELEMAYRRTVPDGGSGPLSTLPSPISS